ncbi:MAG: LexA family transcriptional regulator [Vicingaceae bacterium]
MIVEGLSGRVKEIRKGLRKTQASYAKDLGITQGNLSLIERGKTILNLATLQKMKSLYGFSYSWIIEGKNELHGGEDLIPLISKASTVEYPQRHNNKDFIDGLSIYRIPGFNDGNYRIFEIEGESMLPTLLPHDFIVSLKIEDLNKVEDGALCVIVLKDAILIKRIYKNGSSKLTLESDNHNYKSIQISKNEVKEVWAIQAKLTQMMQSSSPTSEQKLEEMEQKLIKMQEQIDAFQKQ